jgi:pimeloyl-ACP methyl ester carboxylesterase
MRPPQPYFRETGAGPAVICFHAGYGSSAQWRSLMELLADRFRVLASDLSASGKSPPIAAGVAYTLDEEVAFLAPVFEAAGSRFHLVGHSFGGAVALKAAARYAGRVQSLTLFEPTLFALLASSAPGSSAMRELLSHTESTCRLADDGEYEAAAERFVDYWFEQGAWALTREEVRADIRGRMTLLRQRWDALIRDPATVSDLTSIGVPVLCLTAENSNPPTRALCQLLIRTLARVRSLKVPGVGHMAPLTHPDRVNPLIRAFLEQVAL